MSSKDAPKVEFGRRNTRSEALSSTNSNKIFFPTDSGIVVFDGREFGRGSAIPEYLLADPVVEAYLCNAVYDINAMASATGPDIPCRDYCSSCEAMPVVVSEIRDIFSGKSLPVPLDRDSMYHLCLGNVYAQQDSEGSLIGWCRLSGSRNIVRDGSYLNVRDLGGIPAAGGARIRPGRIFRGGVPSVGEGYRFDLAVRLSGDADASANASSEVSAPMSQGFRSLLEERDQVAAAIHAVIGNVTSSPDSQVFVHGVRGVDRTGAVCAVLESLLGVGWSEIVKDYTLSAFNPVVTIEGQEEEWHCPPSAIAQVCQDIKDSYGSLLHYAVRELGITWDEIEAFCYAMLDNYGGSYSITATDIDI